MFDHLRGLAHVARLPRLHIRPVKTGDGWLHANLPRIFNPARTETSAVQAQADVTNRVGRKPLWSGYHEVERYPRSTSRGRTPNQVRTRPGAGALYTWLAERRRPDVVVEFGTAFGVSGMYWLTGLERAGHGHLMTYEPNEAWAGIAQENLAAISSRFTLTRGTFEDHAAGTLKPESVDIAFVDAIHTSAFVKAQYATLSDYLTPGALVLFDDIGFSADMRRCWEDLANRPEVTASYQLGTRVGIVELAH